MPRPREPFSDHVNQLCQKFVEEHADDCRALDGNKLFIYVHEAIEDDVRTWLTTVQGMDSATIEATKMVVPCRHDTEYSVYYKCQLYRKIEHWLTR